MDIRLARYADITQCLEIGEEFWNETPYADSIEYSQPGALGLLTGLVQARTLLVAESDSRIVGMAALLVTPFHFNPEIKVGAEIFWYVSPSHRESGTGEDMLVALEELARYHGATLWSMGSFGHKGADRLLNDHGYKLTESTYSKVL